MFGDWHRGRDPVRCRELCLTASSNAYPSLRQTAAFEIGVTRCRITTTSAARRRTPSPRAVDVGRRRQVAGTVPHGCEIRELPAADAGRPAKCGSDPAARPRGLLASRANCSNPIWFRHHGDRPAHQQAGDPRIAQPGSSTRVPCAVCSTKSSTTSGPTANRPGRARFAVTRLNGCCIR